MVNLGTVMSVLVAQKGQDGGSVCQEQGGVQLQHLIPPSAKGHPG